MSSYCCERERDPDGVLMCAPDVIFAIGDYLETAVALGFPNITRDVKSGNSETALSFSQVTGYPCADFCIDIYHCAGMYATDAIAVCRAIKKALRRHGISHDRLTFTVTYYSTMDGEPVHCGCQGITVLRDMIRYKSAGYAQSITVTFERTL